MLKKLSRAMSNFTQLRSMNKEGNYQGVIRYFEAMKPESDRQKTDCFKEYEYAQRMLNLGQPVQAEESGPGFNNSQSEPLYFEKLEGAPSTYQNTARLVNFCINVALAGSLLYLLYQIRNPMMGGMDGRQHIALAQRTNVSFDDVKGINECREELEEIVDYLKHPQKYIESGAKMPKGLLLTGKPGTGKTLLAKAIAGEAGVRFFYNSGSDFEEVFVGLGAKRIRELFQVAKQNAPCIVFIDEIDAVGSSRKSKDFNYNRQTLNQLLVELDGFHPSESVLVIGATNFAESLDHALKRPGRFDKVIDIPSPDVKGRQEIIELYLNKVHYDESVNSLTIARGTTGMTGADLANLINMAALNSVKRGRSAISAEDVDLAKDRILMGVERSSLTMTSHEKYLTAVHELGHALTAYLTPGANPVHKTTILPRGPSLGVTILLPERDNLNYTREQVLAQIDVCMGGRAAEEIFWGVEELTTGCSDDLNKATKFAYQFVKGGMFEELTGLVNLHSLEYEGIAQRNAIDRVVRQLLDESYERVKAVLLKNKQLIAKTAEELVEKESLTSEEFKQYAKAAVR